MAGIGAVACLIPARRALGIEAMVALREDSTHPHRRPWRTHSCVPRSHSCERLSFPALCSQECEHGTHECVRHVSGSLVFRCRVAREEIERAQFEFVPCGRHDRPVLRRGTWWNPKRVPHHDVVSNGPIRFGPSRQAVSAMALCWIIASRPAFRVAIRRHPKMVFDESGTLLRNVVIESSARLRCGRQRSRIQCRIQGTLHIRIDHAPQRGCSIIITDFASSSVWRLSSVTQMLFRGTSAVTFCGTSFSFRKLLAVPSTSMSNRKQK